MWLWLMEMYRWIRTNFYSIYTFDVGDGTHVHLWHDRWCGDHFLKEVFPILFECSIARETFVTSMLVRQTAGEMRSWDVSSLLNFNDWEFEVVDSINYQPITFTS